MKILFCIHQLDYADHIALAYLSAIAKQLGHSTHLCILENTILEHAVDALKPDIVAYSANIMGFNHLLASHKIAKKRHDFISIMGGPHPTVSPETFHFSGMDVYCIGEGEEAFSDFLTCVKRNASFDDIPNLITEKKSNPVRPLEKNLDKIPFPDRDLVLSNSFLKTVPKKTFYATRGCPFKCHYCCNNYYHKIYRSKGPLVRRFSVDRIISEIEHVRSRYRTDFIKFGDDIFALKADEWLEDFSEKYKRHIGIPFNCYLRFDWVDENLLTLLKEAGCFSVHLSADSVSGHVRENILGRQMKEVDIVEKLSLIRSFGINTWVNFMLAAPESSLDDDLGTISLSKSAKVTYTNYSTTVPMKGTVLFDNCVKKNLVDASSHISDMNGCSKPSVLSCFSDKEINIRFNIYLLGAVIAKMCFPFNWIAVQLIKIIPPNPLFQIIRDVFLKYNIENRIFKLHRG